MSFTRLNREQALRVRESYNRGHAFLTLASRYGVSKQVILKIVKGNHSTVKGMPDITCRKKHLPRKHRGLDW